MCWRAGGQPRLDVSEVRTPCASTSHAPQKISSHLGDAVTVLQRCGGARAAHPHSCRFPLHDCRVWWVRLCLNPACALLAVGNSSMGCDSRCVLLSLHRRQDLRVGPGGPKPTGKVGPHMPVQHLVTCVDSRITLETKKCSATVRQIDVSDDGLFVVRAPSKSLIGRGRVLVAACEDGSVLRWDRVRAPASSA